MAWPDWQAARESCGIHLDLRLRILTPPWCHPEHRPSSLTRLAPSLVVQAASQCCTALVPVSASASVPWAVPWWVKKRIWRLKLGSNSVHQPVCPPRSRILRSPTTPFVRDQQTHYSRAGAVGHCSKPSPQVQSAAAPALGAQVSGPRPPPSDAPQHTQPSPAAPPSPAPWSTLQSERW